MLIKNVRLLDRNELVDIRIENDVFSEIGHDLIENENEEILDGNRALASAPFVEPHVHLDTTLTAG